MITTVTSSFAHLVDFVVTLKTLTRLLGKIARSNTASVFLRDMNFRGSPRAPSVAPSKSRAHTSRGRRVKKTGRKCSFALIWVHIQNVTVCACTCEYACDLVTYFNRKSVVTVVLSLNFTLNLISMCFPVFNVSLLQNLFAPCPPLQQDIDCSYSNCFY